MSERIDYLPNKENVKIYQDDEMFCINTDTQVLGEFLNIYRNDIVLDLGTNNGALLIYASFFNPKKLIGLELNERALELAKKNMEINNIKNYELINADLTTYTNNEVDVIICNPPYFKTRTLDLGLNKYKSMAKHECTLTLQSLVKAIERNLKNNGTLFFLYKTSRLAEVFIEFKKNNLEIKEMQFVFDDNKEESNVCLIRAVKNAKSGMKVLKQRVIKR